MKNFGEELAYWYFRLNGFFLIDDFVLHKADLDGNNNADSDLVGIRNPHTYERIGLDDVNDNCPVLNEIIPDLRENQVAIICEVKAGTVSPTIRLGDRDRIRYVLRRIGTIPLEGIDDVAEELSNKRSGTYDGMSIHKIVISNHKIDEPGFAHIPLAAVDDFIWTKFTKYYTDKIPAWTYFPSSLMQYFMWRIHAGRGR